MPLLQRKRFLNLNHAGVYAPAPSGLGLQTNLTGFWSFENTSWTDDTGNGTTLTGTGSPTTTTGKVGNGASLVASTSYLSAANNTNINAGTGSFSVALWVNANAVGVGPSMIFSKGSDTFGNRDWGIGTRFTSNHFWEFQVYNAATADFRAQDTVAITTGSFVHLVGTIDSSTGAVVLYRNGSSVGTATQTGTINSTTTTLNFGRNGGTTSTVSSVVDQAAFWKGRVLSAGDVTALYNGGSGLSYAAMA